MNTYPVDVHYVCTNKGKKVVITIESSIKPLSIDALEQALFAALDEMVCVEEPTNGQN